MNQISCDRKLMALDLEDRSHCDGDMTGDWVKE
jgi:hypothetical protein